MLDKIINFIAEAFTPKVVSATNTNQNVWIGGYIQCWKRAGIIMYRIAFKVTAVTSRTTIGTIPEAYRPRAESYYYLKDGGLVVFGANGSIEIQNASGGSYYETAVCIGGGYFKDSISNGLRDFAQTGGVLNAGQNTGVYSDLFVDEDLRCHRFGRGDVVRRRYAMQAMWECDNDIRQSYRLADRCNRNADACNNSDQHRAEQSHLRKLWLRWHCRASNDQLCILKQTRSNLHDGGASECRRANVYNVLIHNLGAKGGVHLVG